MSLHRSCRTSSHRSAGLLVTALLCASAVRADAATRDEKDPRARVATTGDSGSLVPGISRDRMVAPASLLAALARIHRNIPSFSRQTKLACSACHYQFPQLTPFGRLFKLNGYTLTGLETIGQPADTGSNETLKLAPIPPASAMVVTSFTNTAKAQPETQNGTVSFPQQFSLFLAGQITPKLGAFTQFTYAAPDGSFGIDNVDIRYATHTSLSNQDLLRSEEHTSE